MCPNQSFSGYIFRSENRDHARVQLRSRDVDHPDECARILRTEHGAMQHSLDLHVVNKFTCSQQFFRRIQPRRPRANSSAVILCLRGRLFAKRFCSQLDRAFDFLVPSAAAKIVADRGLHLSERWARIVIEQRLRADQHARHAEAALYGACLAKRAGVDLLLACRNPFGGCNFFPVYLRNGQRARPQGLPVNEHRAGAADSLGTGVLHRCQSSIFAQIGQQILVCVHRNGILVQRELEHGGRSSLPAYRAAAIFWLYSLTLAYWPSQKSWPRMESRKAFV